MNKINSFAPQSPQDEKSICDTPKAPVLQEANTLALVESSTQLQAWHALSLDSQSDLTARGIRWLVHEDGKLDGLLNWNVLKAALISHDPELVCAARTHLMNCLHQAVNYVETKQGIDHIKVWAYVGNVLAMLPYFEPPEGIEISIPTYHNEQWQTHSYQVKRIHLNDDWGTPSIAYALEPTNSKKDSYEESHALLLFMGTAPSTTSGAMVSIWADFCPGKMVGEELYEMGKERIEAWVEQYDRVVAFGQSLGGALAQIAVAHHPEKVQAHVFNAPNVNRRIYHKAREGITGEKDRVFCFNHRDDLVCKVGTRHIPGTRVFIAETPETYDPFSAHARIVAGHTNSKINEIDAVLDLKHPHRHTMNFLHALGSYLFFIPLTLLLVISAISLRILGSRVPMPSPLEKAPNS